MRNEKGITLIALILIVVLFLVLAVISVMLAINGEKEEDNKTNTLVYNQEIFDNAYNEYSNSAEAETTNETEPEVDANVVDTTEPEATNTVTNEV